MKYRLASTLIKDVLNPIVLTVKLKLSVSREKLRKNKLELNTAAKYLKDVSPKLKNLRENYLDSNNKS